MLYAITPESLSVMVRNAHVWMLYAELRVNRLHVRGHEADRQPPGEFREDVALQVGLVLFPGLLFLLRMSVLQSTQFKEFIMS